MLTDLLEFLKYLALLDEADAQKIPALDMLAKELGINRAALREQVAVARALGLVTVKPRTGTQRLPYTFAPAIKQSLGYAIVQDINNFKKYSDMRAHIEAAYFIDAVKALREEDVQDLKVLVDKAWEKLKGNPPQIPHKEHRDLHMTVYRRLDNVFAIGILEAYWEAYEAIELNIFTNYDYLTKVWTYHTDIVNLIESGEYELARQKLIDHTALISVRPQ